MVVRIVISKIYLRERERRYAKLFKKKLIKMHETSWHTPMGAKMTIHIKLICNHPST